MNGNSDVNKKLAFRTKNTELKTINRQRKYSFRNRILKYNIIFLGNNANPTVGCASGLFEGLNGNKNFNKKNHISWVMWRKYLIKPLNYFLRIGILNYKLQLIVFSGNNANPTVGCAIVCQCSDPFGGLIGNSNGPRTPNILLTFFWFP